MVNQFGGLFLVSFDQGENWYKWRTVHQNTKFIPPILDEGWPGPLPKDKSMYTEAHFEVTQEDFPLLCQGGDVPCEVVWAGERRLAMIKKMPKLLPEGESFLLSCDKTTAWEYWVVCGSNFNNESLPVPNLYDTTTTIKNARGSRDFQLYLEYKAHKFFHDGVSVVGHIYTQDGVYTVHVKKK